MMETYGGFLMMSLFSQWAKNKYHWLRVNMAKRSGDLKKMKKSVNFPLKRVGE